MEGPHHSLTVETQRSNWCDIVHAAQVDKSRYGMYAPDGRAVVAAIWEEVDADAYMEPVDTTTPVRVVHACLSVGEVHGVFERLKDRFGFQRDACTNVCELFISQLESHSCRNSEESCAIEAVYAQYIWNHGDGPPPNYQTWCLRVLDHDPLPDESCQVKCERVALWLLVWGEAANLRYMPECLCFVYHLAWQYHQAGNDTQREFLDHVVTPLYAFIRDQAYKSHREKFVKRERDHSRTIGYDDVNDLFMDAASMQHRICLVDGRRLSTLPAEGQYAQLHTVDWKRAFYKTYKERRTMWHVLVNYLRFWILHVYCFYMLNVWNATFLYADALHTNYTLLLCLLSLGGALSVALQLMATVVESLFVPVVVKLRVWTWNTALFLRVGVVTLVLGVNMVPAALLLVVNHRLDAWEQNNTLHVVLASLLLAVSMVSTAWLLLPSNPLRFNVGKIRAKSPMFHYAPLTTDQRMASIALWICVWACKLLESFCFVVLPFTDAFRSLYQLDIIDCPAVYPCAVVMCAIVIVMVVLDFLLFVLDTYVWYVVWSTLFSVGRAIHQGISFWRPWSRLYQDLPHNMSSKVFQGNEQGFRTFWNTFIMDMYRDHHISMQDEDQVPLLLQGEHVAALENAEFRRRVQFLALTFNQTLPPAYTASTVPHFTVLIPHYSEKILLDLVDVLKPPDMDASSCCVSALDYLKRLYPTEWRNFAHESKLLAVQQGHDSEPLSVAETNSSRTSLLGCLLRQPPPAHHVHMNGHARPRRNVLTEPLHPAYSLIGYRIASDTFTLRTRMWASLRMQTVYRTFSGMFKYKHALDVLDRINGTFGSASKFSLVVSMQRLMHLPKRHETLQLLFALFPTICIAYIDQTDDGVYYSCLLDKDHPTVPRFRIRLPGNPILGDGKADNQNHAIIFTRGEYLQLVDANQDHYFEECLKVVCTLREFTHSVANVGSREYIFSENIGSLSDIAAGKEATFVSLYQRVLCHVGGKLHYGHPDFVNVAFATTHGGISKGTKRLHLNEDIYAGMNSVLRGGIIRHADYVQCGKGRDLGFCSILHFSEKIASGAGEQVLSREQYDMATTLPLDRFLTFFYAHMGFLLNYVFIMLSTFLFLVFLAGIATLEPLLQVCIPLLDPLLQPPSCLNLGAILTWMERSLISISIVIVITFLPLFTHLLLETGLWSACKRLFKQWLSLSLLFEVFVAQVHASAFLSSLKNAKAKYHATGRGLAISRQSFISLYAAFSRSCILFGMELTLLLAYVGTHIWIPHFGYFCVVCVGLAVSPFLFNPYQFGWTHTMVDYGQWLSWMWTDKDASWSRFVRGARVQVTGLDKTDGSVKRAWCPWFVHGVFPLTKAFVLVTFYLMGPGLSGRALAAVVRAVVLFGAPLLLMSVVCLLPRGWTKLCTLVSFVGWFIALVLVEGQNMSRVLLLLLTLLYLFSLFTSVVTALLPREPPTPTQGFRTFLCTLLDHLQFPVDMVVGHVLFVPLMVLTFIPFINRLHTTFLLWIPPWVPTSRGIYSAAQRRRRRHLAIKYLAYFLLILALTVVTCACLFTL